MLQPLRFQIVGHDNTSPAFAKVRTEVAQTKSAMAGLRTEAGLFRSAIAGFAGGFAFAAISSLITQLPRAIGAVVNEASGLVEAADRIGLTTDALQELHFQAGLAGVETNELDKAMEQFSKRIGEAFLGTGNLVRILEANNVALRDQHGNVRPVNALLADYADLMENASSEQERMLLATEAFGRGGMGMVNVLEGGSRALRESADEARELGAVLDEELVRDAERIGDEWDKFTTRLGTSWKTFILSVVSGADAGSSAIRGMMSLRDQDRAAGAFVGGLLGKQGQNFPGGSTPTSTAELLASLGLGPDGGPLKATILPGLKGGSGGTDTAQSKIESVIASLTLQTENLFRTNREQEIYNRLAQAGVDINSEAGQKIAALSGGLFDQSQALDDARQSAMFFAETMGEAFSSLIPKIETGNAALDKLLNTLIQTVAQAFLLGQGPLAGIFGTSSGIAGVVGGLLGGKLPGFAGGGSMIAGGSGGPDSQIMMARVSPGERIDFRPRGQGGAPSEIRLVIDTQPSPLFKQQVRAESANVAVSVVKANDQQNARSQELGG